MYEALEDAAVLDETRQDSRYLSFLYVHTYIYIHTYVHTYIYIHMHAYIHTYVLSVQAKNKSNCLVL